MAEYKYLIIGGGVAGTTAAETIRKNNPDASVALVNAEPHRLYSRVMLSKPNIFLGKVPFEQIWLKSQDWYAKNKIDFLSGKRAVSLNTADKTVGLDDEQTLKYDKLLLAIGACARRLPIPGVEKQGIFYVRTLEDGQDMMQAAESAKHAVVVGGSFIGFEMADLLRQKNIDVSMVFNTEHCWEPVLDPASGRLVENILEQGGVKIYGSSEIKEIQGEDGVAKVVLKNGTELPCDMLIFGVGVFCPHEWLKQAGVGLKRGIITNEFLETSAPDVWAAGDVAEYRDLIVESQVILGAWINAQEQGKTAALNMLGQKQPFKKVSFYATHGFGATVACVGDAGPAPDRERVVRAMPEAKAGVQLFVKNGRIVGATTVNRPQDVQTIVKLIEGRVEVGDKLKELSDPKFDLKTLLAK